MIVFISIVYDKKRLFEDYIITSSFFEKKLSSYDHNTNKYQYPLMAEFSGMRYMVDEYKGYISGSLKMLYQNINEESNWYDLTYTNLIKCIDFLEKNMIYVQRTKISKLYFGLSIQTCIPASQIIKINILMHNLNEFNHDKSSRKKKEIKIFEHHNYDLEVSASKIDSSLKHILNIQLKFKKSAGYRKKTLIQNLLDLQDKQKLRVLFNLLLQRYDELTIVDTIESYDRFDDVERKKMLRYMNVNYWAGLKQNKKRQEKYLAKKDFERLLVKYNLIQLKNHLRLSIIQRFEDLLNN